jgi:hypothetical protein
MQLLTNRAEAVTPTPPGCAPLLPSLGAAVYRFGYVGLDRRQAEPFK